MADLNFVPEKKSIALRRGKGGSFRVDFKDADGDPIALPTTGWASQIRVKELIDAELLMTFTIDASTAASGYVTLSFTGDMVAAMPANAKKGFWDLDCADADDCYVAGVVTIEGEVTDS